MGDYKRDSEQDNSMDCPIWGTDDISDEELLKELEAVKNMAVPLPIPSPSPDEFEKIWARIQEERAESADTTEQAGSEEPGEDKVIRVRFGWKRLAAIGLIACLIAGSGSIVAVGRKSYFFRERKDEVASNGVVFNNDMNKVAVNGEEEAYALIQEELDIKPIKLGYMPANMKFSEVQMGDGYVTIVFLYENDFVYLVESKYEKEVSYNYKSDIVKEEDCETYNKSIGKKLEIKKEIHSDNKETYESSVIIDGACYSLIGTVNQETFIKIAEKLMF